MDSAVAAAFAAGLLGGVHCAGMCGGIVGTFALQSRGPRVLRQLAFNGGRIGSYAIAGGVVGFAGGIVQWADTVFTAQATLFVVANIFMVLLGLYIAGWGRGVMLLESAAAPLWSRIAPHARGLLPVDGGIKAIGAGALWGWVPCGLVYSMLVLALASGSAARGALVMLAFGLGTLPNLLAAGLAAQRVLAVRRLPWIRRAAGVLIMALGAVGLARVPVLREMVLAGWECFA